MEKNQNPTIKLSDNTIECYTLKCNQERFENITLEVYLLGDLYCIIVIDYSDPKNRKYSSYELSECETSVSTIEEDLKCIKDKESFDRYMENETVFIEHFDEKALNSLEPIYESLKEIIESHLLRRWYIGEIKTMSDKIATAVFNPKSVIFKNMLVKAYKEVGESLGYVLMIRGHNEKGTVVTHLYGINDEDLSYNVLTELIVSVKFKTVKAFNAFIEDVSSYKERFVGEDESETIPSSIEKIIYRFSRRRVNWDIDDLPSPEDM